MGYKTYTRQMLADFTGRPLASFPEGFVSTSAIPQALLLFKIGTCLASPDDLTADQQQMLDFAVLAMADAIHLAQPYQTALASPFNSESIGSYSYSKVARAIQKGDETGVMWFDLAIDKLSVCDQLDGSFAQGGIEIFENDGRFAGNVRLGGQAGNVDFLSPADLNTSRHFGYDPAPAYRPPSSYVGDTVPSTWREDPDHPGLFFPPGG